MKHTIIRKKQEYPTGAWRTIETRATLPSGDAGMVRCSVVTFWQVPTGNYGAIAYPLRSTSRTSGATATRRLAMKTRRRCAARL